MGKQCLLQFIGILATFFIWNALHIYMHVIQNKYLKDINTKLIVSTLLLFTGLYILYLLRKPIK